jgi:hypothetical protein
VADEAFAAPCDPAHGRISGHDSGNDLGQPATGAGAARPPFELRDPGRAPHGVSQGVEFVGIGEEIEDAEAEHFLDEKLVPRADHDDARTRRSIGQALVGFQRRRHQIRPGLGADVQNDDFRFAGSKQLDGRVEAPGRCDVQPDE